MGRRRRQFRTYTRKVVPSAFQYTLDMQALAHKGNGPGLVGELDADTDSRDCRRPVSLMSAT
jgi:hypothetical protein